MADEKPKVSVSTLYQYQFIYPELWYWRSKKKRTFSHVLFTLLKLRVKFQLLATWRYFDRPEGLWARIHNRADRSLLDHRQPTCWCHPQCMPLTNANVHLIGWYVCVFIFGSGKKFLHSELVYQKRLDTVGYRPDNRMSNKGGNVPGNMFSFTKIAGEKNYLHAKPRGNICYHLKV